LRQGASRPLPRTLGSVSGSSSQVGSLRWSAGVAASRNSRAGASLRGSSRISATRRVVALASSPAANISFASQAESRTFLRRRRFVSNGAPAYPCCLWSPSCRGGSRASLFASLPSLTGKQPNAQSLHRFSVLPMVAFSGTAAVFGSTLPISRWSAAVA
jgi:hypothetical protein